MIHLGTFRDGTTAAEDVFIQPADWLRHCYLIGATGAGKTTLLRHIMNQSPAFCLIDKEGDLAREIADAMPCIYLRAGDLRNPFGLNILENVRPDDRSEAAGMVVAMFSDIWDLGTHTPQLIDQLYAAVRLALDTGDSTLLDIPRILTDDAFRGRYLKKCKDRETREFWEDFNVLDKKAQRDAVRSTLNKARAFSRSLPVRLIFGQINSTVDVRDVMDSGKTVVLDLSGIEPDAQKLIGSVFTFQFYYRARQRTGAERPLYTLIIDEFRDFASRTMPYIAAESRKRGLALCVGHQYVDQLTEDVQKAIFANFGTFVVFNIGQLDAPLLSRVLDTLEENLTGQRSGHVWAAVMQDGRRHRALPITIPFSELSTGYLDGNIKTTTARHTRKRHDIDYQIAWYDRVKWAREQYRAKEAAEAAQIKKKPKRKRVTKIVEEYEEEETGW